MPPLKQWSERIALAFLALEISGIQANDDGRDRSPKYYYEKF